MASFKRFFARLFIKRLYRITPHDELAQSVVDEQSRWSIMSSKFTSRPRGRHDLIAGIRRRLAARVRGRHVSIERPWRPARQQNRERRSSQTPAIRRRSYFATGTQPASKQVAVSAEIAREGREIELPPGQARAHARAAQCKEPHSGRKGPSFADQTIKIKAIDGRVSVMTSRWRVVVSSNKGRP